MPCMDEPCDICRAADGMRPLLDVSLSGVLDAVVRECSQCGFRQVRPRLQRHELSILYPDDYFESGSSLGFSEYYRQQQRDEREAYFLAKLLRRTAPTGRILDVGCALGFLLDGVQRFTEWNVTGIDVSRLAVYFARERYGLDARCGTLDELRFEDRSFDFIVQKDLLEHVPDPRAHVEETARILKPGGFLWTVTPNGDANIRPLQAIVRKIRDRGEDRLPRLDQGHVSFFRLEHLLRLFSDCGFDCVRARSTDISRGMRALGILPMKKKSFITGPRGNVRKESGSLHSAGPDPPEPVATDGAQDAELQPIYREICEQMDRSRKPLRSAPAYFYFRRFSSALKTLPASLPYGNDFDLLLRKR